MYSIRQVDLSDLPSLQETFHRLVRKEVSMPFLLLTQDHSVVAYAAVVIAAGDILEVAISCSMDIPEKVSTAFAEKTTTYFEQQLLHMFGTEESLKTGIRRFNTWINQNRNSKLV